MAPFILALFCQLGANRCNEPDSRKEKIMLVTPMVGFTLLAALFAVAGLLMMSNARTEQQQVQACTFMVIVVIFVVALLAMIVI